MRRGIVWVVVCLVVGLFAAHLSAQEINACVKNENGQLRIVEGSEDCNNSEYFMSWNVTGPPGDQGPQGNPGPTGRAAPQRKFVGFAGGTGVQGTGDRGIQLFHSQCFIRYLIDYSEPRMCTSQEFLHSVGSILIPPQEAWVHPVYAPVASVGSIAGVDVSGVEFGWGEGNLSCDGWSTGDAGKKGLVVSFPSWSEKGLFRAAACSESHFVACCALDKDE